MKVCGQNMEVNLPIHGRKMTFSEPELIGILEEHFSNEATEQVTMAKVVAQGPTEDQWFDVNPQAIDQTLFQKKRRDKSQENARKQINEALCEVKSNPEKYGKKFQTKRPKKTWSFKTVAELKQLACELGDHNADWVERALELAQRICNGESWEAVCNNADTANWYRLVIWKNGYARLVGGSSKNNDNIPASCVNDCGYDSNVGLSTTVPSVVRYEK